MLSYIILSYQDYNSSQMNSQKNRTKSNTKIQPQIKYNKIQPQIKNRPSLHPGIHPKINDQNKKPSENKKKKTNKKSTVKINNKSKTLVLNESAKKQSLDKSYSMSKSKERSKSKQRCLSSRPNVKNQMRSTKLVTQRSDYRQKQYLKNQNYQQSIKKIKRNMKKPKEKAKDKGKSIIKQKPGFEKEKLKDKRMKLLNIKTELSERKSQYFDEQYFKRIQVNDFTLAEERQQRSSLKNTNIIPLTGQTFIKHQRTLSKEKQVQTEDLYPLYQSIQKKYQTKDLKNFKKVQSLKWRLMLLQLQNLKQNPNKIGLIIQQSELNRKEVVDEANQALSNFSSLQKYSLQNPVKVQQALGLNSKRWSFEEQEKSVKNLSDKKLLHELQMIEQNNKANYGSNDRNLSAELQKEFDMYSSGDFGGNTKDIEYFEVQQDKIQNKRLISLEVTDIILKQLCIQIISKKLFLHAFLTSCLKFNNTQQKQKNIQNQQPIVRFDQSDKNQEFQKYVIGCDKMYTLQLLGNLFNYIQREPAQVQDLMRAVNIPFNNNPLTMLKCIRKYSLKKYEDQVDSNQEKQQQNNSQSDAQQINQRQVLSRSFLDIFQSVHFQSMIQEQYFYNYAVYNCIGDILDTLRPYGLAGRPCISIYTPPCHKISNYEQIISGVVSQFVRIITLRVGQSCFEQNGQLAMSPTSTELAIKKSQIQMQRMFLDEEDKLWSHWQDFSAACKYEVSDIIFQQILLYEVIMFYSEFVPQKNTNFSLRD